MTNNSGPKKSRRQQYDYLNRQGTVKTRQEFIETDYVDGVYDSKGNQVMRPLTPEEREWLSQFYAETEHGNFKKTQEIEEQEKIHKALCKEMRHNKKRMTSKQVLELKEEIDSVYKKLVHLRAETNTFYTEDEDRREIYTRDNKRREDVFNRAKATNHLISYDIPEFDQFTSKAEKDINVENLVLDYLVRKPTKKVIRKRKSKPQ